MGTYRIRERLQACPVCHCMFDSITRERAYHLVAMHSPDEVIEAFDELFGMLADVTADVCRLEVEASNLGHTLAGLS